MKSAKFIVLVDFGSENAANCARQLERHARHHLATLVCVDTSQDRILRDGVRLNEAFEFSGYQYGLEQALQLVDSASEDALLQIAFVNGTALTSHLGPALRYCLSRAFAPDEPSPVRPRLRGLVQPCQPPTTLVALRGFYVPTFAFSLSGPARSLARVVLYDRAVLDSQGLARRYDLVGPEYGAMVDAWLSPTSPLKGWYQALPNAPLDPGILQRKRLAIYLEHSMPDRLAGQGVDVSLRRGVVERVFVRILMWTDRVFVNLLKIRYRLRRALRIRS